MSLHADVAVPARDRRRLERLCHYVARPPLASDRLEERPDGRLALRLKTRWRDGTTHILMEPHELLERLVPLIPPPRAHQVRYHGVLAPCASARDQVVPGPRPTPERIAGGAAANEPSAAAISASAEAGPACAPDRNGPPPEAGVGRPRPRRLAWAELLQRVFAVDALHCPRCGTRMRLIAAIEDPDVARKILACLGLPARAPPLWPAPSASTGQGDEPAGDEPAWAFGQTPPR